MFKKSKMLHIHRNDASVASSKKEHIFLDSIHRFYRNTGLGDVLANLELSEFCGRNLVITKVSKTAAPHLFHPVFVEQRPRLILQ